MNRSIRTAAFALGIASLLLAGAGAAFAQSAIAPTYEVTITNLTKGQIISPPVVITHNAHFNLFMAGEPASDELAALAEDGMTGPLVDMIDDLDSVADFAVGGDGIPPGASMTLEVRTRRNARLLTAVGMLVSTNDAFASVHGVRLPFTGARSYLATAYDAGSEGNSENCDHIPGPPCMSPGVRNLDGAEGYVYVHSGIFGIDGLDAATYDWNNPVAMIYVKRVR